MTTKSKNLDRIESTCDKYLQRIIRYEQSKKQAVGKSAHQTKAADKEPIQKQKSKNSQYRPLPTCVNLPTDDKKPSVPPIPPQLPLLRTRQRSLSANRSSEKWGTVFSKNVNNNNKVNNTTRVDYFKCLSNLSKELKNKLESNSPKDQDAIHMITEIDAIIRKIPTTITTEDTRANERRKTDNELMSKITQTPPMLCQEDTEKLQSIIADSTKKLETSMKQLESICLRLQNENEELEKELKAERRLSENLSIKVRDVQNELDNRGKQHKIQLQTLENQIKELQSTNEKLLCRETSTETAKAISELQQRIADLESKKMAAEQKCARIEYDFTISNMEKEKYVVMLAAREREITEIHQQMTKIQDEVHKQLMNLNKEIGTLVPSATKSDTNFRQMDFISTMESPAKVGDSLSSISTNYSYNRDALKECGDAEPQDLVISVN